MAVRRARAYKLFRETKTKTLNITTALVMITSSLGGALPLMFSQAAAAAQSTQPTITSPTGPVTVYTDTTAVTGTVKDNSEYTIRVYASSTCTGSALVTQVKPSGSSAFSVILPTVTLGAYHFGVTAQ